MSWFDVKLHDDQSRASPGCVLRKQLPHSCCLLSTVYYPSTVGR